MKKLVIIDGSNLVDGINQLMESLETEDIAKIVAASNALGVFAKALTQVSSPQPTLPLSVGSAPAAPSSPDLSSPKPLKKRGPIAGGKSNERRMKIARYLAANGPAKQSLLINLFDIPSGGITNTITHEWFARGEQGVVSLTEAGSAAVGSLGSEVQ